MIDGINKELEKIESDQQREQQRQWEEKTWKKNRGKGFVGFDRDRDDNIIELRGHEHPIRIVMLIDNFCGSAGDMFVYCFKQSPKITVVGRPTMGINDYSNLFEKTWNDQFQLLYPTTRLNQLDDRKPDAEQGVGG